MLRQVHRVYPDARLQGVPEGLMLYPSQSPVAPTSVGRFSIRSVTGDGIALDVVPRSRVVDVRPEELAAGAKEPELIAAPAIRAREAPEKPLGDKLVSLPLSHDTMGKAISYFGGTGPSAGSRRISDDRVRRWSFARHQRGHLRPTPRVDWGASRNVRRWCGSFGAGLRQHGWHTSLWDRLVSRAH